MIAAIVMTVLPEALRFLSDYRMLIYAVILIVIMLCSASQTVLKLKEQLKAVFFGQKNGKEEI